MYAQRRYEMARAFIIFQRAHFNYIQPLYEHHIKMGMNDSGNEFKYYTWDDASRIVGYYDYVLRRITKYGLHRGAIQPTKYSNYKSDLVKEEEELVDYFLYEMRKQPAAPVKINAMM